MNHSLRFLFLLYHYPPSPGIAPKRNYQISTEIAKRAAFSLIFTAKGSYQANESDDAPLLQKIPTYDYRYFLRKRKIDKSIPGSYKRNSWYQRVIKLINTFPFNIIMGEGGLIYFINVVIRGNKAIRKHKISHIYSSYRPFADHYAAYMLKKLNPQVYWIADFRDLIIDPHYNHVYFKEANHNKHKKIFNKADLITTVSDGLAKHLREYNSNVITLKNGIRDFPEHNQPVESPKFGIAYTGSMYLNHRNALPLFWAIKELIADNKIKADKVRIIYAGKDGADWKHLAAENEMSSMLVNKGMVSAEEATHIQHCACINLLLTSSSDQLQGVLTGKMTEYFSAGGPVLAIVKNQIDLELELILHELQIGKSFSDRPSDLEDIKKFIHDEYLLWLKSGTNRKPVNMDVLRSKYSIEETMKPLMEILSLPPTP